jgi:membrane protease YdiL (CAAX protease family)
MAAAMGRETSASGPPGEEQNPPRTHFHLVLGGVFFPLVSVVVGWTLAILHVIQGSLTEAQQKWTRMLVALVVVDAFVAAAGVWIVAHPEEMAQAAASATPRPRIGIVFESEGQSAEPRLRTVLPKSPAERAGLRPRDRIEKVDGVRTATTRDLTEAIQKGSAGAGRLLSVQRGDASLEVTVVPELPRRLGEGGLFETWPESDRSDAGKSLALFVPAVALVTIGWLWTRRRAPRLTPVWWGFLIAAVASFGVSFATLFLFTKLQGGGSIGGVLIALLAQMATLLGVAAVLRGRRGPDSPTVLGPALTPLRTGLQGVFYLITGWPRIMILLWTLDQIVFQGHALETQALETLAGAKLGVAGTGLFLVVVVVLGPFAEELLFRGFLVPRLAAEWGSGRALVVSSALFMLLHPHYGLYMPVIFLYGWVFGWARLRSGRLAVPVLLHMTVNGLSSALMLAR